jgi:hypothetical protein
VHLLPRSLTSITSWRFFITSSWFSISSHHLPSSNVIYIYDSISKLVLLLQLLLFFYSTLQLSHRYSISVPFIVIHMHTKSTIHSFIHSFIHSSIHSAFNNPKICKNSIFFSNFRLHLYTPCFGFIARNHAVVCTCFWASYCFPFCLSLSFYTSMWRN